MNKQLPLEAIEEAQKILMPDEYEKARNWYLKYVNRCGCGATRQKIVDSIHLAKAQFCHMKYATDELMNDCNKCLELAND